MPRFFDRYLAGEHDLVWRELIGLGESINEPGVVSDAELVAEETVNRAFLNCRKLVMRLTDLGYLFQDQERVLEEASDSDQQAIDELEATMGKLPLIIRKWYDRIKSVDFTQLESQLLCNTPALRVQVSGLGLNTPLVILPVPS